MSSTLDTNILVYSADSASPFHTKATELLEQVAAGPDLTYLLWPVIMGYLRISTHPSIFRSPLTTNIAQSNINDLLFRPHIRTAGEPDNFWQTIHQLSQETPASGNQVPDLHLVALMRAHGISTIWSHDRDLRRFSGIQVRDPLGA